jgi:hypothetical protein
VGAVLYSQAPGLQKKKALCLEDNSNEPLVLFFGSKAEAGKEDTPKLPQKAGGQEK